MLEGIVRRLLVDRFGRFVHGVDDARLSSGLTSGQLLLSNLRLKEAAAEVLGLAPAFDLRHGTISRMRVDLPGITSFSSKPVTIRIEDVFLLLIAAPSDSDKVDILNQAKIKARSKKLNEIEIAMSTILLELSGMMTGKDSNESGGFLRSLIPITVILANLRVEIVNIHIRCEDNSATQSGYSFAFGVTTQRLQLRAVNDSGQETFLSETGDVSRRKVDITNFSFYWDCDVHPELNPLWGDQTFSDDDGKADNALIDQMRDSISAEDAFSSFDKIRRDCFIVAPASAFCFVQINSNLQDFNTSRSSISCVVPKLQIHFRSKQFRDAKSIINYQVSMRKRIAAAEILLKLQSRRPSAPSAKSWWRYALLSIVELIRSRSDLSYGDIRSPNWSWMTLRSIADDRRQYIELYSKRVRISEPKPKNRRVKVETKKSIEESPDILPEKLSDTEELTLQLLEDRLPVGLIVLLRSLVHQSYMVEQVIKAKVENKNAPGYFSWLFAGGAEGIDADLSEDQKQAIRKEADIISRLELSASPVDFELIRLDFQTSVICTLYNSHNEQKEQPIASSEVEVFLHFIQYPHSSATKLSIKHLRISDLTTSEIEPLTVLSMYPSSEQADTVMELFMETWAVRTGRNLDLNVKLVFETTKIVWSGAVFRNFFNFLHAGYSRNTLMLFDAGFWEWTEIQQSFLMSAFSRQRKHRIEAKAGLFYVIFMSGDSKHLALAFRSFSIFSEPVSKIYDLIHMNLSNFQVSLRISEQISSVILDPVSLEVIFKLCTKGSDRSSIDVTIPSVNLTYDLDQIRIVISIITEFTATLTSALSKQHLSTSDVSRSPLKKIALFPAVSLIKSSANIYPKSHGHQNSAELCTSFHCIIGIISISSIFCLRLSSIEFSGHSSNWILQSDGVLLYSPNCFRRGWIAQSNDQCEGDKICVSFQWISSYQSHVIIGMRGIDYQWSPFIIQSFIDFLSNSSLIISELYSSPASSASKSVQSSFQWKYFMYLENCTFLFNKRHNRLAQLEIAKADMYYLTSTFHIVVTFYNSVIRDVSVPSLRAPAPTNILFANRVDLEISAGNPSCHWGAVKVQAIGCEIVYFHRKIQELCDYISNGLTGIIFGFNPDKKAQWPDFAPELHGTYCAVTVDFPDVNILIPACGTASSIRRGRGLQLSSKNIHITNSAYGDVDGWRTAVWKVDISALIARSLVTTPIFGQVIAKFSTDYRCTRIPWMTVNANLSSLDVCFDDCSAIRSATAALSQNLGESWVEPLQFPGEPEFQWFLDDISTVTGSSIRIELVLQLLNLSSSLLMAHAAPMSMIFNRNSNWSMLLSLNVSLFRASVKSVNLAKTLPEGGIAVEWYVSGDFQQTKVDVNINQLLLILEPHSLAYLSSNLPSFWKYSFKTAVRKTALGNHFTRETIFSDNSKFSIPSRFEIVELELEDDSSLLIAVPAIAIAIADLLSDQRFVRESSNCVNAETILHSCSHWPSLSPAQIFVLLQDSSSQSLLSILQFLTSEILNQVPANEILSDPLRMQELVSLLSPHESGFLVYIFSLFDRFTTRSFNFLVNSLTGSALLEFWKSGHWLLYQHLDFPGMPVPSPESVLLMWASVSCPRQAFVLPGRTEIRIPSLLSNILAAIRDQFSQEHLPVLSQFQLSLGILFQSPLVLERVLENIKLSLVSVSELIALLLHTLRVQYDPVIPFQFRHDTIQIEKAITFLPEWSRHVLLSIAYFIYSLPINSADQESVCCIVSSAMTWVEQINLVPKPSPLSSLLISLVHGFDGNSKLMEDILIGATSRTILLPIKTEYAVCLQHVHICFSSADQAAVRLSSSSKTSLLFLPNDALTASISFNSLECFTFRSWKSDYDDGKRLVLFLNPSDHDTRQFRIVFDVAANLNKSDIDVTISNVCTYVCLVDYHTISELFTLFMAAFPTASVKSSSATRQKHVRLELQTSSVFLCGNDSPVIRNNTPDASFMISIGLHPLLLTMDTFGKLEQCSFSALVFSDFLHPKVAVWEPVLEPFNFHFSWNRNSLSNKQCIPNSEIFNSTQTSTQHNTTVTNAIQIRADDAVRLNVSADTVASFLSLIAPNRISSIASLSQPSCAFTLKNFTGSVCLIDSSRSPDLSCRLPLQWSSGIFNGVIDDMTSAPLECLGYNPWEPAQTLSLTAGDRWLTIQNAYVGNVGAFQFALIPSSTNNDHRLPQDGLVLETLIENGHAVLSAHSSIGYFNCSSLHLRIVLFNDDLQYELNVDPLQTRWAPLLYCAWDAFAIRVVESGDSVRQLGRLSLSALRRKRRSELVFCVGAKRFVFLCASSGGVWPGRLALTIRAPLDIKNRLPYPIDVKFDDDVVFHIENGSKSQIETIDGSSSIQLRFSMPGFEWSSPIAVFADKPLADDGPATVAVPIQDRFGATLYVVAESTRVVAVDDDQSKLNGRGLFRITLYTRLWLLNNVPGVDLFFGSCKGVILPGQNGRQIIDYVYENQRWYPGKGWSAKLLPGDRAPWSDSDGHPATFSSDQLPGPEWAWVESGWTVDTDPVETDDDGWAYAKNFGKTFHAEHKTKYLVRRRRYSRARIITIANSESLPICMFSPGGRKQLTSRYSTSHICAKTSKSDWSAPINLLHGTDTRVLTLYTHDFGKILDLGIFISPAYPPFHDTWMASFVPRYIIWNSFSQNLVDVCVQQLSDSFNICIVHPGKQKAFFFNRIPFETEKSPRSTYIRVGAAINGIMYWSSGFDINCVGLHVLRVSSIHDADHRIVQLQISLHKASVIIYVSENDAFRPRYSIRNELDISVVISQSDSPTNISTRIEPDTVHAAFAWDLLSVKDRLLCVRIEDYRFNADIDTIGTISALSNAFICVFADGGTNVVLITSSGTHAKQSVQAYNDDSSDSKPDCWLKITTHIEEIAFSLISNTRAELMLIALLSTEFVLTRSTYLQNIEITLDDLRVDNQLFLERNSFVFPNVIKSESNPSHSFLWFQCIRSFHTSDMEYYKLFDLAIQPFVVNLEETYIVAVLEFARSVQKTFQMDSGKQPHSLLNVDSVSPSFGIAQLMYFEVLRTPSIKMQLSVRKAQESLSHEYLRGRIGLAHLLGVLLTNLEAKPIRRPGHEYTRLCDRTNYLREQLLADYKGSLLLEFLASFGYNKLALGGVVPILSTFRAGVRDFRKEIQSSLKQGNIRGGLSRGTFSLVDHTARGLMMPITGLSAGFGDVISALTFDKDFTSRRALNVSHKPQHVADGIIRGGQSIGLGIFNGVAALVREPIKHHRRHPGGFGFVFGIGKGIAQAVASPIVGVFDAVNHVGTGIARTPDYFRRRSSHIHASVHFRLPRAFYGPGRSIRAYNGIDALIVDTLQSVKPPIDSTIQCVFMGGLMNDVRAYALLIRGIAAFQLSNDRYAAKLLWFIAWSSIKSFQLIEHGIKIFSISAVDNTNSSWLLIWLSQPRPAFDVIMATHARYQAALRVQSKSRQVVAEEVDRTDDEVNQHSESI